MLYLLLVLIALRLSYWYLLFIRLALHRPKSSVSEKKAISLIVAVKNNLSGIQGLVTKIQKQNYEPWEMIIVDDGPDPSLKKYISALQDPRIQYRLNDGIAGKKQALIAGIRAAQYKWIAVTDSDCEPASLKYFDAMQAPLTDADQQIVLGFAPLKAGKSVASQLAAYEAAYVGMQYLSYALAGLPYMGVGRNMLFAKEIYLNHTEKINQAPILSGDDDLFVQAAADSKNTTICIHPYSFCISNAPQTFGEWIRQRSRQIATAPHYQKKHQWLLAAFGGLHLIIYGVLLLSMITGAIPVHEALASWMIMVGLISLVQYPAFRKLGALTALLWTPIADLFLAGFYLIVAIRFKSKKVQPWK
jgi:cellulose synthase/poly-beta-1,6-N-acetylglucosamine synthase-like glycosyltransferase